MGGDAAYIMYVSDPNEALTEVGVQGMDYSGSKGSDAFGEAIKGVRRMPRYQEATKDVSGCEKYRRAAKKALTR